MIVELKDGRRVRFPEGTSNDVALAYISKNFPEAPEPVEPPGFLERAGGHLMSGVAQGVEKLFNLASYFTPPSADQFNVPENVRKTIEDNPWTRAVQQYPETNWLGQMAGGIAEFIPQIPLYATGGRVALGGVSTIPKIGKYAEALLTKSPTALANYGKSIARAAVEGGVVGTVAGTPGSTPLGEKLIAGAEEAAGFAGAVTVLHPIAAGLGVVGRALFRRNRGDVGKTKTDLQKRADEGDKGATEDLATLNDNLVKQTGEGGDGSLYVPKGEEVEAPVEEVVPTKKAQGQMQLEPLGKRQMEALGKLGYTEEDIVFKTDKELLDIIDQKIPKAAAVAPIQDTITLDKLSEAIDKLPEDSRRAKRLRKERDKILAQKEVPSDQANEAGLQGGIREGEEPLSTEPIEGGGGEEAAAGGVLQTPELEGQAEAEARPLTAREKRTNDRLVKAGYSAEEVAAMSAGQKIDALKAGTKVEAGSVQKLNIAGDIKELLSMGYPAKEIKKMKPQKRRDIIEAAKNVPEPTSEENAKALEAATRVREAVEAARSTAAEAKRQKKLVEEGVLKPEEAVAPRVELTPAQLDKIDKEIEAIDPNAPISQKGDALVKLATDIAGMEDATLDTLIENMPRSAEEIEIQRLNNIDAMSDILAARRAAGIRAKGIKEGEELTPEGWKASAPKTREELEAYLAEKRGKDRRERKPAASFNKEKYLERLKAGEGAIESEPVTKGEGEAYDYEMRPGQELTFDSLGFQSIYERLRSLVKERRTIANAPHKEVIAELNGRQLTQKQDADFVDGMMAQVAKNVGNFVRNKAMSPDFAFRNNEKVEPLIFNIHKKFFEGNHEASKQNEVIRASELMLSSVESKEKIKGLIEGTRTDGTPEELQAAAMTKGELAAVRERYKGYLRDEMKRNLNEDENAALAELIAGRPMPEVLAKYKERKVEDKLGRMRVRKWLDEEVVKDIFEEYKAIDKWGIDDYMTHHERGTFRIVSGGKLYAKALSEKDAARKFADLIARDQEAGVFRDYQLDTSHHLEDLATGLSRRSYQRIVAKLEAGLKDAIDGINSTAARRLAQKGLEGRFFIKPTKQFSPYTLERREFLEGEKNVFDILYNYMYSMNKKIALDPAIDDIRRAVSKMEVVGTEEYTTKSGQKKVREIKAPFLKEDEIKYLERYVEDVKGKFYKGDELVDAIFKNTGNQRMYSRAIQASRELQANLKLGYAPVKGLINAASGMAHIYTKTGLGYITEAAKFLGTEDGKQFIKAMDPYLGVNIVESATGELTSRGTMQKWGVLPDAKTHLGKIAVKAAEPLTTFQMPELPVRKLTVAANYLMAKADGLPEAAARDAAIKANWFQQFTYDIASLPEAMRGPTGKLVMQFKPYLLKELEFISSLRGPEIARYIGCQIALGGVRGLVMVAKSLPWIGAYQGWRELEDYLNKNYPVASRGIGGVLGTDVTAAATFQFPSSMRDWLGPTLSDIVAFNKNVASPMFSGENVEFGKFAGGVFPTGRHWARLWEQVVDRDGWVKDERGRRLWNIDNMGTFTAKSLAGAEPIQLNRIRVAERNLVEKNQLIAEQKVRTIDNILDAVAKGKDIDPTDMQDAGRLGIQPSTLRRAARFRVLDPKQRRLLMTEIIRRPEILEMYPEQADLE